MLKKKKKAAIQCCRLLLHANTVCRLDIVDLLKLLFCYVLQYWFSLFTSLFCVLKAALLHIIT